MKSPSSLIIPGLLLRLGLGFLMLWTGMAVVFRGVVPSHAQLLADRIQGSLQAPQWALVMGIAQLVVGLLILLGLFTRVAAVCAVLGLIASIVVTTLTESFEVTWCVVGSLTIALTLTTLGAGALSLDSALSADDE